MSPHPPSLAFSSFAVQQSVDQEKFRIDSVQKQSLDRVIVLGLMVDLSYLHTLGNYYYY